MRKYYLEPRYDGHDSFYKKAEVVEEGTTRTLYSYKHKICTIEEISGQDFVKLYPVYDGYGNLLTVSATSLRHLKEFLRQNDIKAESKTQILNDYEMEEA